MSEPKTGYPIGDKSFVVDLRYWRAERPDEFVMDRFIREAARLEQVEQGIDEATKRWSDELLQLSIRSDKYRDALEDLVELAERFDINGQALAKAHKVLNP